MIEHIGSSTATPLRVVIVDDHVSTRRLLRRALAASASFEVVGEAGDGSQGLQMVGRLEPDAVLVDLDMPVLDGVGMIRGLRELPKRPRTLVLTSNGDRDVIARAIDAGADGYVLKGCRAEELRAALRQVAQGGSVLAPEVARRVVDDYARLLEERRERDLAVIETLATLVEARDAVTGDHCNNVARMGLALYRHVVGSEPEEDLVYGFMLHDIGKISIPDAVLLKPGPLDEFEIEIMRRHVELGTRIVGPMGFRPVVTDLIRAHHERWDGDGYPRGLRGTDIPIAARVFSVVDAFDAMTADRPYRKGMSRAAALEELIRNAGTQFDPAVVDAFLVLEAL